MAHPKRRTSTTRRDKRRTIANCKFPKRLATNQAFLLIFFSIYKHQIVIFHLYFIFYSISNIHNRYTY